MCQGNGGISDLKSLIVYWTSTPTRHFQNSTHNGALLHSGQKAWVSNSAIFFYVSIFVCNVICNVIFVLRRIFSPISHQYLKIFPPRYLYQYPRLFPPRVLLSLFTWLRGWRGRSTVCGDRKLWGPFNYRHHLTEMSRLIIKKIFKSRRRLFCIMRIKTHRTEV